MGPYSAETCPVAERRRQELGGGSFFPHARVERQVMTDPVSMTVFRKLSPVFSRKIGDARKGAVAKEARGGGGGVGVAGGGVGAEDGSWLFGATGVPVGRLIVL